MQTDTPALMGRRIDEAPTVPLSKEHRANQQTGVKQTGDKSPEQTVAPLVPPFEQTDNRKSDYRRTVKAASRFWRGSTKVLPK